MRKQSLRPRRNCGKQGEEGKVVKSRELSSGVDLLVLFLVIKIFISYVSGGLFESFQTVYNRIPDIVYDNGSGLTVNAATKIMNVAHY